MDTLAVPPVVPPGMGHVGDCGVSVKVKTSPVEKIFVIQKGRDCYQTAVNPGESLTEASFPLTGKEGWFRIQVRDSRGLFAGSNAYFIDQL